MLALGALEHQAEHLELELDALEDEAARLSGALRGSDALHALRAQAEERRAAIAEQLPYSIPTDWVLATSGYGIDEYERKAREIGSKFGREIDDAEAAMLRRQLLAVSVTAPDPLYVENVPALTSDTADDAIVHDALRLQVDLLVSDDKHIVPKADEGCREYEHGEYRVQAVRFNYLLENYLNDIDWDEIDGRLLGTALASLNPDRREPDPTG